MVATTYLRRAQRNLYGYVPIVVFTRDWPTTAMSEYLKGANAWAQHWQQWIYDQAGKTIRILPAVPLLAQKSYLELQYGLGGDAMLDVYQQLEDSPATAPIDFDGEPVSWCNAHKIYVLHQTGVTRIDTNRGRVARPCAADPTNPLDPYGPARAAGAAGGGLELLRNASATGPTQLVATAGAGLTLNYTGGTVRIPLYDGSSVEYVIAGGSLTMFASTTNRVYVDEDGVVKVAPQNVSTTLNGAVAAGATSVMVASAVNITAGRNYYLGPFDSGGAYDVPRVASVVGTTVNLVNPLRRAHANGATFDSTQCVENGVFIAQVATSAGAITSVVSQELAGRGAILHEGLHCCGFQHPSASRDGAGQDSASLMGFNYVNFPACILTDYERAQARAGVSGHFFK